jgi:prepilin-type N-terminal cleavage/methylation domain-containing protein/prepilin-type processing-associated H-X9-DG protein
MSSTRSSLTPPLLPRPLGLCAGFTMVELLVVISIIMLLAALVVPVVKRAQNSSMKAGSVSNLRQIGVAMMSYTAEHGRFPPPRSNPNVANSYATVFGWVGKKPLRTTAAGNLTADKRPLNAYLGNFTADSEVKVAHAPADRVCDASGTGVSAYDWFGSSYSFNFSRERESLIPENSEPRTTESISPGRIIHPARFIVAMEYGAWDSLSGDPGDNARWYSKTNDFNLLFADGHVGFHRVEENKYNTTDLSYSFINE